MTVFKPFRAYRPVTDKAKEVAALPYDVMNEKEARAMVRNLPDSFLRIDRAEVNLPEGTDPHADAVYETARELLEQKIQEGVYVQEAAPVYYIYRLVWKGRAQTGIVGLLSVEDYENDVIKKHEFTRAEKEKDRIRHVDTTSAHTGPIFITYRAQDAIRTITEQATQQPPEVDITFDDGVTHQIWPLQDEAAIRAIEDAFLSIPTVYIADGHHRAASAVRVGQHRRDANPGHTGREEYNYFLSVVFPDEDLLVLDYNRVVEDLNGLDENTFLEKIAERFTLTEREEPTDLHPDAPQQFVMVLDDKAYTLTPKAGSFDADDPVYSLDASILQENLLRPVLGIDDPRTNDRIDFVGGIRGQEGVTRRLKEDMRVGFLLYPTSIAQLMRIADAGEVMPPKSTWFEPKLRSGLFIHKF